MNAASVFKELELLNYKVCKMKLYFPKKIIYNFQVIDTKSFGEVTIQAFP